MDQGSLQACYITHGLLQGLLWTRVRAGKSVCLELLFLSNSYYDLLTMLKPFYLGMNRGKLPSLLLSNISPTMHITLYCVMVNIVQCQSAPRMDASRTPPTVSACG